MGSRPLQVLVAGGGVAGLEALLALRDLAGGRVELTLLSPEEEFVYRPMAVAEPFGRGRADRQPAGRHRRRRSGRAAPWRAGPGRCPQPHRHHRRRAASGLRRPARRGRRTERAGVSPSAHLDAGDRRRAVRQPAARPRRGVPQARGVHRAAGGGLGPARLRAGADDRLAGLGHGTRRCAGNRLHPRGRPAGTLRHAGNRGSAPRPRGSGGAGRDGRVRRRGPARPGPAHPSPRRADRRRRASRGAAAGRRARTAGTSRRRPRLHPHRPARQSPRCRRRLGGRRRDRLPSQAGRPRLPASRRRGRVDRRPGRRRARAPPLSTGAPGHDAHRPRQSLDAPPAGRRRRGNRGPARAVVAADEDRRALPPPYLAARHGTDAVGEGPQPDGQPVELDLERDVPATADALRQASLRGEAERTLFAQRRAEARRESSPHR
jgi:hypothetical protein